MYYRIFLKNRYYVGIKMPGHVVATYTGPTIRELCN